jgi:hypothetical protein
MTVEIGDLFDETGVIATTTDELAPATAYVFRAYVNAHGATLQSRHSAVMMAATSGDEDCTRTPGYWKNHEAQWSGVHLQLGSEVYTAAELGAILGTRAAGNGALALAHQLIAVLLNIVVLDADDNLVRDARAGANALLSACGSNRVPPHGTCFVEPEDASSIAQILDDFNSSGSSNCLPVAVEPTSWGAVKAGYR